MINVIACIGCFEGAVIAGLISVVALFSRLQKKHRDKKKCKCANCHD
jgi:hypothetical protein